MTGNTLYDTLLIAIFVIGAGVLLALLFVDAPYGRHQRKGWGPTIPTRLGWVLMEAPASLVFFWFWWTGPNRGQTAALVLLGLWQLHYVHRAFIYPFRARVKPGDRMPLMIMLSAFTFCSINGYLNGAWVGHYAPHLGDAWLSDPRFIVGIVIFIAGYALNKQSDRILRSLRDGTSTGYRIPYGGGFRFVSMPNYLGEIITWVGFAIAAWSLAGVAFVFFTLANLLPRAIANHRWYLETFPDYPKNRKAMFPFLI